MIYKNKSSMDLFVPGFGNVKAGGTIDTKSNDRKIENVNFEEVKESANPQSTNQQINNQSEGSK